MKDDDNLDLEDSNSSSSSSCFGSPAASSPPGGCFAAEFDALLADIVTGEPLHQLEEEIARLRAQIAAALRRQAVTPEHLQRRYRQLAEVKGRLKEGQTRLEGFLGAPEVAAIEAARRRAAEQRAKTERIARFDEYFSAVGELEQLLEQIRESSGFGAFQQQQQQQRQMAEARQSLLQAKALLVKIGQMRGGLFPEKEAAAAAANLPANLAKDFELVLAKLTADVEEWTAVLMPDVVAADSAKTLATDAKNQSDEQLESGNPHGEFIIRTKRILVSGSASLTTELISSDEVLAGFKLAHQSGPKVQSGRLPPLKISRFMVEIKEVIEEMSALFSTSEADDLPAARETFADVCELFLSTSPYLFRVKSSTGLPLQEGERSTPTPREPRRSAVAHNNVIFFAHLAETAVQQTPLLKGHFFTSNSDYPNYVSALRELASTIFRAQMQFEEARLLSVVTGESTSARAFHSALAEIANETPATELKVSSVAHYELRRTLNDCLWLLGALREAFAGDLLPPKLVSRAFSTLVTSLLAAFLSPLVALSDISSLGASHLAHELDYFSGELQPFLAGAEGGGGGSSVAKWIKLNEVNFILKSSLLEIVNRWADGSGLLASYLTAEEVKHLVRALFQNTERRSKALAKIK